MDITDIDDKNLQEVLKITDFEQFFEVYLDKHGNWSYNLNENVYFKFDTSLLPSYECTH